MVAQQGADRRLEVIGVDLVHLRGDLERHTEPRRDLDGPVDALLG